MFPTVTGICSTPSYSGTGKEFELKKGSSIRADAYLRKRFPGLTRNQTEEAIERRLVTGPKGGPLKKGTVVDPTSVDTSKLEAHLSEIRKGNPTLQIKVIAQGEGWCAVDKPAGTACNPLSLFDNATVSHWALRHYKTDGFTEAQPKLCPHRLDSGTTGALLVCFDKKTYEMWRKKFEKREVKKTYLAWVWGKPTKKKFGSNARIGKAKGSVSKRVAVTSAEIKFAEPVLDAETEFEVVRQEEEHFLVSAEMKTGVTHQVRVHLASLGFPIIGDKLYDPQYADRPFQTPFHLLRASTIEAKGIEIKALSDGFEKSPQC